MPNLANAKKALRQRDRRAARNLVKKVAYKKAVKAVRKAVAAGDKDLATKVSFAQKKVGKAAKAGILKKGTAARIMARLMKVVNASA